jgi:hypothetical protein
MARMSLGPRQTVRHRASAEAERSRGSAWIPRSVGRSTRRCRGNAASRSRRLSPRCSGEGGAQKRNRGNHVSVSDSGSGL